MEESDMIVISVELWPAGKAMERKVLGLGTIANDGTGTFERGNYEVVFRDSEHTRYTTHIQDFDRGKEALYLLRDALTQALP